MLPHEPITVSPHNLPDQLADAPSINTGQSFRTTNGVFLWEMGKQFNVTMAEVGNNSTMVNFNGTGQQYADNKLEHCDVSGGESRVGSGPCSALSCCMPASSGRKVY